MQMAHFLKSLRKARRIWGEQVYKEVGRVIGEVGIGRGGGVRKFGSLNTMSKGKVLVTGGSGFVGGHCVRVLVESGYDVRTTVRSKANEVKCSFLNEQVSSGKPVEIVEADLLGDLEQWKQVVQGCDYVMHVASPFYVNNETEDELIKPAVEGTTVVLKAAVEVGGVKRIVVTSSTASVGYPLVPKTTFLTEDDWTAIQPTTHAYVKSKVLAEKAAWDLAKATNLDLVTINPAMIIGPPLIKGDSTSIASIVTMCDGSSEYARDSYMGFVDVRDVASAHLAAMETPDAAGNRFITVQGKYFYTEIAEMLRKYFESKSIPIKVAKDPVEVKAKKSVDFSTEKAERMLGMKFRSITETVQDTVDACFALNYIQL